MQSDLVSALLLAQNKNQMSVGEPCLLYLNQKGYHSKCMGKKYPTNQGAPWKDVVSRCLGAGLTGLLKQAETNSDAYCKMPQNWSLSSELWSSKAQPPNLFFFLSLSGG